MKRLLNLDETQNKNYIKKLSASGKMEMNNFIYKFPACNLVKEIKCIRNYIAFVRSSSDLILILSFSCTLMAETDLCESIAW